MRFSPVLFFVLFLCSPVMQAGAAGKSAQVSTSYIRQVCARDGQGGEKLSGGSAVCQSYIAGVLDYHRMMASMGYIGNLEICMPADVTPRRKQDQVYRYIKRHNFDDDTNAAPSVIMALHDRWGCAK